MNEIDKEEFCERVRACENAMYALARSIVKNEEDACDAVAEAILRAYDKLDTLTNRRAFKTWILRIVHNAAVDILRKQNNLVEVEDIELYADGMAAEEPMDTASKLLLRDAVAHLNPPYRTVVTLFYYEELPTAKIAQITQTSVVTVRKQLHRARKQLKELLDREDFRR